MKFTIKEIAARVNGKIIGNADLAINTVSKIEEAQEGSLTFLANPLYTKYIYTTCATAVLVNDDFIPEGEISATLIKVPNAYEALSVLLDLYNQMKYTKHGIDSSAVIHQEATVGKNVLVGPLTYVGAGANLGEGTKLLAQVYIGENVKIGKNTILHPGVKILDNCIVGSDCIVHSGTVIGSDGFGFAPNTTSFQKVPQIGNVIIEDCVEIGSNTSIDRATLGSTFIRKGVKLDNLIQIAHNVEIGENTVIAAQTGVSGSTKIGRNCMIGGQVGIIGHLTIADEVKIAAQSGVGKSITEKGMVVQGSPAFEVMDYQKSYVVFRRLPDLKKKIDRLEKNSEDNKS